MAVIINLGIHLNDSSCDVVDVFLALYERLYPGRVNEVLPPKAEMIARQLALNEELAYRIYSLVPAKELTRNDVRSSRGSICV